MSAGLVAGFDLSFGDEFFARLDTINTGNKSPTAMSATKPFFIAISLCGYRERLHEYFAKAKHPPTRLALFLWNCISNVVIEKKRNERIRRCHVGRLGLPLVPFYYRAAY